MFQKIVISFTILCLLQMQFAELSFFNSAFAETSQVNSTSEDSSLKLNSQVQSSSLEKTQSEAKAIAQSKMKEYKTEKQASGFAAIFSAEGFLSLLITTSIGFIGQSILFSCPEARTQPDVLAFAAGASAYLIGEIQAWIRYKNLDNVRFTYTDGAISGEQKKSLEGQREAYKQMLSIAKVKYMLQLAAAAAFATAAGLAAYRHFFNEGLLRTCDAALKALTPGCSAYCASLGPTAQVACQSAAHICDAAAVGVSTGAKAGQVKAETPSPSLEIWTSLKSFFTSVKPTLISACGPIACSYSATKLCTSAYSLYETSWVACYPQSMLVPKVVERAYEGIPVQKISYKASSLEEFFGKRNLNNLAQKFFSIMIPEAKAVGSFMDLLGLSTTGIGILMGLNQANATWFDRMMFSPLKRATIFGITAGLSMGAAAVTSSNMTKIENNIKKLDEILKETGSATTTTSLAFGIDQNARIPIVIPSSTSTSSALPSYFPCTMVGNQRQGCGSVASAITQTLNDNALKGFTLDGSNSSLAQLSQLSGKMADGIQGQSNLSQGALDSIGSLANKNAMAQKLMNDAFKKIDDQAKKYGQGSLNLAGMNKKILGDIQAASYKALQARGYSPASAALALGAMDPMTKDEQKKAGASEKSFTSIPDGGMGGFQAGAPSFGGGSLVPNEEGVSKENLNATNASEGAVIDMSKVGDINNESNVSIFDILTQRYFKSGLDKLGIQTKKDK